VTHKVAMNILDKARRLEGHLSRGMTDAARTLVRRDAARDPIELTHAIVQAAEREIQPGGRGTRVFPFNTIDVAILAASEHARARLEIVVNGVPSLPERITERLRAAGCAVAGLTIGVSYVARAQKQWGDPQFGIAFSNVVRHVPADKPDPAAPRLEMTVINGAAEHRSYAFSSPRIDLGRGAEVRDGRSGLIRTNHVAFAENSAAANRTVSRQHAHVAYDPASGHFRVRDDGSVHGTKVVRKGRTVPVPFGARGVRLQPGDDIVLGEARVRIKF
jgi:hypothetical protein